MLKVYLTQTPDLCLTDCYKNLSKSQLDRIMKYKMPKNQKQSLGCQLLLCQAVCDSTDGIIKPLEIAVTEFGKPFLADYMDLNFNLSHSEKYSVCAISDNLVGVDIEKIEPFGEDNLIRLSKRILKNTICTSNIEFLKYWTVKEAFLKAIGIGISKDLTFIDVDLETKIVRIEHGEKLYFQTKIIDGFMLAVVSVNKEDMEIINI